MRRSAPSARAAMIAGWCDDSAWIGVDTASEAPARAMATAMRAAKRPGRWGMRVMAVSVRGSQPAKRIPAAKDANPGPGPRCLA